MEQKLIDFIILKNKILYFILINIIRNSLQFYYFHQSIMEYKNNTSSMTSMPKINSKKLIKSTRPSLGLIGPKKNQTLNEDISKKMLNNNVIDANATMKTKLNFLSHTLQPIKQKQQTNHFIANGGNGLTISTPTIIIPSKKEIQIDSIWAVIPNQKQQNNSNELLRTLQNFHKSMNGIKKIENSNTVAIKAIKQKQFDKENKQFSSYA